jgi:ethanolamine kinase
LAPPLLARFKNGLLYRYIIGQVCTPKDLVSEPIWRAVARRLGEWHARLPVAAVVEETRAHSNGGNGHRSEGTVGECSALGSRRLTPNIWSVMQKWVHALPCDNPKQEARKRLLQQELSRSFKDLDNERGPGLSGCVFGHCDLLSANVIMLPQVGASSGPGDSLKVSFIDYEYATPCPAAFDIANHFAEWGGYDCDYNMLPHKPVRRQFLQDYLESFSAHSDRPLPNDMLDILYDEVDRYRGMPGFYWGVWALIQATISQIDFDYASYAEVRLGEYYAWRAEENGSRMQNNLQMPLREQRWAQD